MNLAKSIAVVVIVSLFGFYAVGQAAEPAVAKIAAAYKGKPGACYVLLKPHWGSSPHVEGGNYPICRAVLDNFNKFCDEPPPYERRKLHPTTKNLSEPLWEKMDVKSNIQLVMQTYGAISLPQFREERWQFEGKKVLSLAESGALRLSKVDLSADLRGGQQTVYMLENSQLGDPIGYNQPRLMFSERGKHVPSAFFDLIADSGEADLWKFRNSLFLISYQVDNKWFVVKELYSSRAGPDVPVTATTSCSIQHINDR